jgi:hypothetical protein
MDAKPLDQPTEQTEESFLKPKVKAKRNLTDEQRLVLAQRMRAINDKRIADAMAKKSELPAAKIEEPPLKLKEQKPARRVIKVVEVSEDEGETETESEDEVQYVVVPKKKVPAKKAPEKKPPAKKAPVKKPKPQPVYESEEDEEEAPKIVKKKQSKSPNPVEETPKIFYRFL